MGDITVLDITLDSAAAARFADAFEQAIAENREWKQELPAEGTQWTLYWKLRDGDEIRATFARPEKNLQVATIALPAEIAKNLCAQLRAGAKPELGALGQQHAFNNLDVRFR